MSGATLMTVEIERKLMDDAKDKDAWEAPINVPESAAPRPSWYGRSKVVILDPDVAEVFSDSESVNHALRALKTIIQHQTEKTHSD